MGSFPETYNDPPIHFKSTKGIPVGYPLIGPSYRAWPPGFTCTAKKKNDCNAVPEGVNYRA